MGGEPTLIQRPVVLGDVLRVLRVAFTEMTYRGHAEPVQVGPGFRRVALEIAIERF